MILREATLEYLSRHRKAYLRINPAVRNVAEAIAKKYESKEGAMDGWLSPEVPWSKLEEQATNDPGSLMEAHGSAAWGQLMRAGIQMQVNTWYSRYENGCLKIAQEVSSDKRQEWYAPLFGSNWPRKVEAGTPFPEQEIKGQDLELINVKWGMIESFTRELFDDDQTNQIGDRTRSMGESTAGWEDAYFSRRYIGDASTDYPEAIEASGWSGVNSIGTAITTPFSVNMYETGIGNRPASYVQLGYGPLLTAFQRLRQAKDPMGLPIVVNPNKLLVSTFDEINAEMLLKSSTAPFVPPDPTTPANVGLMRGAFAQNPLVGRVQPVVNIHLKAGVWSLCQSQRGYVLQRRDPMEVVQEMPQTGASFETDTMRFRTRARWEQDWIDPRFSYLGNDGSASLTQP